MWINFRKKRYFLSAVSSGVLLSMAIATTAWSDAVKWHNKDKNGDEIDISVLMNNGKAETVSINAFRTVNRSFHECGIEVKRGEGVSRWVDKGNETSVTDESGSTVSIKKRGKDIIVIYDCGSCASTVLLVNKGNRYVGRNMH